MRDLAGFDVAAGCCEFSLAMSLILGVVGTVREQPQALRQLVLIALCVVCEQWHCCHH